MIFPPSQKSLKQQERLNKEWIDIDGVLGVLLLKTELFDLKDLNFLPGVLEKFDLHGSWMALLYALGYESTLRKDKIIPETETAEGVQAFFEQWLAQPAAKDLSRHPDFLDKRTIELRSTVLDCDVSVSLSNDNRSLFLAESILAGIEAFLATSLTSGLFVPHASRLHIRMLPSDFIDKPIEFTIESGSPTTIIVRYPKESSPESAVSSTLKDRMVELMSHTVAHIAMFTGDSDEGMKALVRDEQVFGRALLISGIETFIENILGKNPKLRLTDWNDNSNQTFPLKRESQWRPRLPEIPANPEKRKPLLLGSGDPPKELFDVDRMKHGDRKVLSLINIDLWNKAGWGGTGFITSNNPDELPLLAPIFKDRQIASKIFEGLRSELGSEDKDDRLRVSIITGINRDNPAAYRVVISANPDGSGIPGSQFIIVARINTMEPKTSENLDRFLKSYQEHGRYKITPATARNDVLTGMGSEFGRHKEGAHCPAGVAT